MDPRARLLLQQYILDVPLWQARKPFLFFVNPKCYAKVIIVLSKALELNNIEEKKVLTGMLSVLELKEEEYCLAWLKDDVSLQQDNNQPQQDNVKPRHWKHGSEAQFWQALETLFPKTILLLGESLINVMKSLEYSQVHATFHPAELIKMPENKKKAYQSLLNLKKDLMGTV